jgi:hypothetical protein
VKEGTAGWEEGSKGKKEVKGIKQRTEVEEKNEGRKRTTEAKEESEGSEGKKEVNGRKRSTEVGERSDERK